MDTDFTRDLEVGHKFPNRETLRGYYPNIAGGIGLPGRNPGFAVVAGLRPVQQKGLYEIHVLDEIEEGDLRELLTACRGVGARYRTKADESFRWYADSSDTGAQRMAWAINGELPEDPRSQNDALYLAPAPVSMLNEPRYPYMLAQLREWTKPERKQLFLKGGKAAAYLRDVPQGEDPSQLPPRAYPAIEALAFVVEMLRNCAQSEEDGAYDRHAGPPRPNSPMTF